MRVFVCVLDPASRGISDSVRLACESLARARAFERTWHSFDEAAVLTAWDDPYGEPLVATDGDYIAVGSVRLDNRPEVEQWASVNGRGLNDLELVLRAVARSGTKYIPQILGDFAFVVWHAATRTVIAATDALGVKRIFYAERNGFITFASRAEAIALDDSYEVQYLAELLSLCTPSAGLTVYSGVRRLPAATIAELEGGRLVLREYWSADRFEPDPRRPTSEREAPEICRQLLADSLRLQLARNGNTWAQLSGGLDSSSIVSMTQWLAERGAIANGLGGTVTFVDWQQTDADEREYSNAVVGRWSVRNETIVDPPFWLDDHVPPPRLDQPRESLAFYPRERRLCDIVQSAGGRILLAGFGSDELFTGSALFFADWLAQGRVWAAASEMARWAAIGRVSFWQLAYGNALRPLLPTFLRRPRSFEQGRLIPWIARTAARAYGLQERVFAVVGSSGPLRRKYHNAIVENLKAIAVKLDPGAIADTLDVRYPFLYRPLVEFALRLPPDLCARPQARKWVLREAMRNILPETVRNRIGKGGPTDVLVWSLTAQRPLLEPLVHKPILAELGVVDAAQFRAAFDAAPLAVTHDRELCTDVQTTLMVEAWLRIRSGRWPREPS